MVKRYLAIDPGQTTGMCFVVESHLTDPRFRIDARNEVLGLNGHLELMDRLLLFRPDVIICERFQHRPNQIKADLIAVEYIGVIKLCAQSAYRRAQKVDLVMQPTSVVGKTAFFSDDNKRVRALGLYDKKAAPHGMDALRHFLYYQSFGLGSRYFLEKLNESD